MTIVVVADADADDVKDKLSAGSEKHCCHAA